MEEFECVVCGCSCTEDEAVFDMFDNATCLDCDREQEEYDEYLGEE
jgi:hypothetical protein